MIANTFITGNRTDRLLKGCRKTAPPSQVMVYRAKKDKNGEFTRDATGQVITDKFLRVEPPYKFIPKFDHRF